MAKPKPDEMQSSRRSSFSPNTSRQSSKTSSARGSRRSSLKKTILKDLQHNDSRRVSFNEQVGVRLLEEIKSNLQTSSDERTADQSEPLSDEVKDSGLLSPQFSQLSLDDFVGRNVAQEDDLTAPRSSISEKTNEEAQSREYVEMDLRMRLKYPRYYHFLKSHMVEGARGVEEIRAQEAEFKLAIIGCKHYPDNFFKKLETVLKYYENHYENYEDDDDSLIGRKIGVNSHSSR